MMVNKYALKYTKESIVQVLRGYIYNSENYQHLLDDKIGIEDIKKLKVYDGTPDVLTDFPMAVISGTSGQMQALGLGDFKQEQTNEYGDIIGYLYGGSYTFNLTLECATLSSFQDEFFSDFLVHALRVYLYRILEKKGIIVQSINYNGSNTVNDKNNIIFVSNTQLTVFTQWSEYVDLLDLKNISIEIGDDIG